MSQITRTLKTAVALAPLLAACGSDASGGSTGIMFPTCTPSQVITRDANGNLVCTALPAGTVTLPSGGCTATQGLTYDGMTLSCVPLSSMSTNDTMLMTDLTTINSQVQNLGTQITTIAAMPGSKPLYVGETTATTTGQITSGTLTGLPAATAICAAQFGAGARMCTPYDMYNSAVAGKFTPGTPVPAAWVFAASWKYPAGPLPTGTNTPWLTPPVNSSVNAGGPQEGTSDNCGSYTYNGTNRTWTGVSFQYQEEQTGFWGLRFNSGQPYSDGTAADAEPGAPCNAALPIACCK